MFGKNGKNLIALAMVVLGLVLSACSAQANSIELRGQVQALSGSELVVDGKTVALPADIKLDDRLSVGDTVVVTGSEELSGAVTASGVQIEMDDDGEIEIYGTVEALTATAVTVGGQTYEITAATEFDDQIAVGDFVKLHVVGMWVREIELAQSGDDSDDDGEIEIYGTVEALTATSVTVNGQTYEITAETEFDDQIAVGDFVKLHVVGTWVREIELAMGDDDDDSDDDDDDSEIEIYGTVEALTATSVTVNGQTYEITAETEFDDQIAVGDSVKLHVVGTWVREIELADDDMDNGSDDDMDDDDDAGDDMDDDDDDAGDDMGDDDDAGDDDGDDAGDDMGDDDDSGDDDGDDSGDDDSGDDDSGDDDSGDDDDDDDDD